MRQESGGRFIEVPGLDLLAARELLNGLLVQLAVLIALSHGHKPLTFQGGQHRVCSLSVFGAVGFADDRHRRYRGIIPKQMMDSGEHSGFAIAGGLAVENEHTLLIRHTQHGVAQGLLQILGFVLIFARHLVYKLLPPFAPSVLQGVIEAGLHGKKVPPVMLPKLHFLQVVSAIETVDKIGISVELR